MVVCLVYFCFNSVGYVFLLLCLLLCVRTLTEVFVPWLRFFVPWLRFFRAFSSVVRQMPGYTSQRRGTARTLPISVPCIVCDDNVLFYVLFDCVVLCIVICVNVYYCHRVSTQLQLNISYHITPFFLWNLTAVIGSNKAATKPLPVIRISLYKCYLIVIISLFFDIQNAYQSRW
jgi:hypothetical protein